MGATALVERGDLLLPQEAPWLGEFLHEPLGFPRAKHDDQIDALVHLLGWASSRWEPPLVPNAGPELLLESHYQDGFEFDDYVEAWFA